jgi:hypothetical protein
LRFFSGIAGFVSLAPFQRLTLALPERLATLDKGYRGPSELIFRSPLEDNVQFTVGFPLHLLAFQCARFDFPQISRSYRGDCEKLFQHWILFPLRFHFASELSRGGFFARNTPSLIDALATAKDFASHFPNRFVLSFALIQTILMRSTRKFEIIDMIAGISGLFLEHSEPEHHRGAFITFCFLHFIACLIYDRSMLTQDLFATRFLCVLSHLLAGPVTRLDIEMICGPQALADEQFLSEIASVTARTADPFGVVYTLSDSSRWHPLSPMNSPGLTQKAIHAFLKTSPLVPFPNLPSGLESLLLAPVLFAVEYHVLSGFFDDSPSRQIVFRLLIAAATRETRPLRASSARIKASSIRELASALGRSTFHAFAMTSIAYLGQPSLSLIDLLIQAGNAGFLVLRALGLPEPSAPASPESPPVEIIPETPADPIQSEEDFAVYPVIVYGTVLPDILERGKGADGPYRRTVSVKLATMRAIGDSSPELSSVVHNAVLPRLSSFDPITDATVMARIVQFLSAVSPRRGLAWTRDLMASFTGELSMIELRIRKGHRVDQAATRRLLRNFFLCIWHGCADHTDTFIDDDESDVPAFQGIFIAFIAVRKPPVDFRKYASPLIRQFPDSALKMRLAALFEHFVLEDSFRLLANWDELLDGDALRARYGTAGSGPLPRFAMPDLPNDFVRFFDSPWKIDIANNNEFELGICLLTGTTVSVANVDLLNVLNVRDVLKGKLAETFTFVLILTGGRATSVIVSEMEFAHAVGVLSCYADDLSDENRGFRRGDPVRLWPERLTVLEAMILSGDWVLKLPRAKIAIPPR